MQEYQGGKYGPIRDSQGMIQEMATKGLPLGLKAVHFGTREELALLKRRANEAKTSGQRKKAQADYRNLRDRIERLEGGKPL